MFDITPGFDVGSSWIYWQASKGSKTLSGVNKFEICDMYVCIWMYVKHNSSAGMY